MFGTLRHCSLVSCLALALLGLAGVAPAFAQSATGRLAGAVADPTGARIAGAVVVLSSRASAFERMAKTDGHGEYTFELVPPGRYSVRMSARGFGTVVTTDAAVRLTETTRLDVALTPTIDAGFVTVTATPPLLQSESAQIGRVIDGRTISRLPLPTRNFQQLLALSPGTFAGLANTTELGRGDASVSVNGQRTTSNNIRINGVDANYVAGNAMVNLPVPATDALQEFIVQTGLYDATQGRNAGGNVEAVTRSGSNELHGNVYEFFRNRALNANDFFLNAAGQPRAVLSRNQFGGTIGGPVVRDRLFFFGSYQGTRERNGASLANSLSFPTIPVGLRDDNRTAEGLSAAFGVPEASIDPISVALLNARFADGRYAVPSPTTATGLTPSAGLSTFREDQYNVNVDAALGAHELSSKWFSADNPSFQAVSTSGGPGNGPTQLPGFGAEIELGNRILAISDTWVLSPTVVNQFRFGYTRGRLRSMPEAPFSASEFGISSPLGSLYPGLPTISVVGLFTIGSSLFADADTRVNTFSYADTLSVVAGRHRLRVGAEVRRAQVNGHNATASRGQLLFPTFDSFLSGQSISVIGAGVTDRGLRTTDVSWFVQDDARITERLTVNLGVRHDRYGMPSEIRGRLINFLPTGFVQARNATVPLDGVPLVEETLVPGDWNNVAPRVGFAYQPFESDRFVVRGGYGVYFDRTSVRWALNQIVGYPYYTLATSSGRPLSAPFAPVPPPSAFPVAVTIPSSLPAPINGIFIDPRFRTPYVQQYGANAQWEFASGYLLDVGYVGSKGTKLYQVATLNQPVYDPATGLFVAPLGPFFSTQKNPGGGIQQVQTSGASRFNSLQASVTKRFGRGLEFLASYTLGASHDTYSGAQINDTVAIPGDQADLGTNYARSDYDRRHRFVASFVYEPTWLGGWQVAGIATFQSGLPFSVVDNPNNFVIQRANFATGATSGELDGDARDRLARYFDTSAFVASRLTLAPGVANPSFDPSAPFGSTGRNLLSGPGQRNVDLSAARRVKLTAGLALELRAEFFNLFNWANFANPNANVAVAQTFGRITSTSGGPRVIQFAAKFAF